MNRLSYFGRMGVLSLITATGLLAAGVSAFYVFQDWAALNSFYDRFQTLIMSDASMRSLFIAEANQNAFRVNCFADGIGVLLGAVLAAIGLHGLCFLRRIP